jgi:hypothetical protein
VKRTLAIAGMLVALLAAWPAVSQQGPQGPQGPHGPYGRRGERMGPPPGRPMPPARELGPTGPPGRPPMERMTPEDRRQLRQDIHQHGRDVYGGRPAEDKQ